MTSTNSNKGQVMIPRKSRERLHPETGDRKEFLVDANGRVTQDITRLKGMIQAERPVSIEEMTRAIEQEGGRQ